MAYLFLHYIATHITGVNDFTLLLHPWIISQRQSNSCDDANSRHDASILPTLSTVVSYGLLQPLCTVLFRLAPVPPFIVALLCAVLHLNITQILEMAARTLEDTNAPSSGGVSKQTPTERIETNNPSPAAADQGHFGISYGRVLLAMTAAALDASTIDLGNSVITPAPHGPNNTIVAVTLFAWTFCFLASSLASYVICRRNRQPLYIGQQDFDVSKTQVLALALLQFAKLLVRTCLGLTSLACLESMEDDRKIELFGIHRYAKMQEKMSSVPSWLSLALAVLGVVLFVVAGTQQKRREATLQRV